MKIKFCLLLSFSLCSQIIMAAHSEGKKTKIVGIQGFSGSLHGCVVAGVITNLGEYEKSAQAHKNFSNTKIDDETKKLRRKRYKLMREGGGCSMRGDSPVWCPSMTITGKPLRRYITNKGAFTVYSSNQLVGHDLKGPIAFFPEEEYCTDAEEFKRHLTEDLEFIIELEEDL